MVGQGDGYVAKTKLLLAIAGAVSFTSMSGSVVFAASTSATTNQVQTGAQQQNLLPGQPGYVGALNNRPSNAEPASSVKSSSTLSPDSIGNWWQYEPGTISVLVRVNNDPSQSGTVENYNFGTYLDDVLPNEWEGSWPTQALEAGAVSVRSFGWYYDNYPKYPTIGAAVDNTTNSQVFKFGTAQTATNNAISATAGQAMNGPTYNGSTEQGGFFKAGTYDSGIRDSQTWAWLNNNYQYGDQYWANQGKSYTWMLTYYYPGDTIVDGGGY